ncbi:MULTISPECIES: hypothetical protein [unclassified Vibrio]|uniref:hypothetical protein n=1 Tax=unclassified Vibrio TaxID=2614977 RepID=UPI001360EE2F|nr:MULTISPECIES: hypothetical protein [unclassified Vibrio]NAW56990.1 hypothetical protein [Vibrio sp. V36_P2S2PM302]NAX21009.1 hypothetical protein [Vibrio sp. V39_P1S14PM300]NAX27640.1 hypothetical protein [Vibrio sp. V38_P2S17PM301]NAX29390.1 hypothetical protein [Vibrio sp. V37_P2S8PM304]
MGSITETPEWEEQVYLIETTDAVIGGEEGIANRQPKQLANRTAYLKKQQETIKDKLDPEKTPDPLNQYMLSSKLLRALIFTPVYSAGVGYTPNSDYVAPAVGQKCYVNEYLTAYTLIQQLSNLVEEATKAADIDRYCGYWGYGTDENGDYFTTPNLPVKMHLKAAGQYGVAGESKGDHIQNVYGSFDIRKSTSNSLILNTSGAVVSQQSVPSVSNNPIDLDTSYSSATAVRLDIDLSRSARTDTYTDSMGIFYEPLIWLPKGAF